MRHPIVWAAAIALAPLFTTPTAKAQQGACALENGSSQADLVVGDPGVVPGTGILQDGLNEYVFATLSVGSWDPYMPGYACIRYQIENKGERSAQRTAAGDKTILGFYWPDIELQPIPLRYDEPIDWYSSKPTKYDSLVQAGTPVYAFGGSVHAVTMALLRIEQTEQSTTTLGPSSGPLKTYKLPPLPAAQNVFHSYNVIEHFPSVAGALKDAHIVPSPVWAIPAAAANRRFAPSPDRLQIGKDFAVEISTEGDTREGRYTLLTLIKILSGRPAKLFSPGLDPKTLIEQPIDAEAIGKFASKLRERNREPRTLEKGEYFSAAFLPISKDPSNPAYYIVDYPVTVQTKERSVCFSVSVFSPYPLNLDQSFCQKP